MKSAYFTVRPAYALWQREIIRFFRQKSRIAGVLLTPLVFWLVLGLGFGDSFSAVVGGMEVSYLEFFYPGVIVLILLFTSIFSNISLIEDRNEGFFQSVMIAPVTSYGIVAGKVLGGVSIALIQAAIFFIFAPIIGFNINLIIVLSFVAACILISIGLTSLGFVIAWKINSIQGFHGIMNVVLVPLWLLSGAVFPAEGAPVVIKWIITLNPIGYGVDIIKGVLYSAIPESGMMSVSPLSVGVTVIFSLVLVLIASNTVRRTRFG
jgi:ABC-2 type transport system permease protein